MLWMVTTAAIAIYSIGLSLYLWTRSKSRWLVGYGVLAGALASGVCWWVWTGKIWEALNVFPIVLVALVMVGLLLRRRVDGIDA